MEDRLVILKLFLFSFSGTAGGGKVTSGEDGAETSLGGGNGGSFLACRSGERGSNCLRICCRDASRVWLGEDVVEDGFGGGEGGGESFSGDFSFMRGNEDW